MEQVKTVPRKEVAGDRPQSVLKTSTVQRALGQRRTRPNAFLLFYLCASALVVLVVFADVFVGMQFQHMAILLLSTAFVTGVILANATTEGVWSSVFLLFVILVLFHCGLYLTPALGGEIAESLIGGLTGWYSPDLMVRAGYLIELGLVAYGLGVSISVLRQRLPGPSLSRQTSVHPDMQTNSIVDVGAAVLIASVGYWYYTCASAMGAVFFLESYGEFRLSTLEAALGNAYLGIAIGAVFIALNPKRPSGTVALVALLTFVAMALAIGLRSSALIPVVAAIAVYARTHRMPPKRYFAVFLIVGLLGISIVQQVRADGLSNLTLSSVSASPIKAVEEMGFSARVVVTSVDWHDNSGDPFRGGATYWAPIERGVQGALGLERVDGEQDFRLMNVEIASRIGQIGGSIIAEAHHNFGPVGVIGICLLAGLSLAGATRSFTSSNGLAVGGIVMVLLLMHVRNSFAPVVAWALAAFLLLAAANILSAIQGKTHNH
jgi:hypothetical protein